MVAASGGAFDIGWLAACLDQGHGDPERRARRGLVPDFMRLRAACSRSGAEVWEHEQTGCSMTTLSSSLSVYPHPMTAAGRWIVPLPRALRSSGMSPATVPLPLAPKLRLQAASIWAGLLCRN